MEWHLCATLELRTPAWPGSGSGNIISWDVTTRCQRNEPAGPGTGVVADLGYFYCSAYSPGTLRVAPYHGASSYNNKVVIATCAASEETIYDAAHPPVPSNLGLARFSAGGIESGYNPCASSIPVKQTTWGGIKNLSR